MATTSSSGSCRARARARGRSSPGSAALAHRDLRQALMGAEVDAICGAAYHHASPERTNRRNGYRQRPWDTRVGTIELGIPKLRQGTYFPDWLPERSRSLAR